MGWALNLKRGCVGLMIVLTRLFRQPLPPYHFLVACFVGSACVIGSAWGQALFGQARPELTGLPQADASEIATDFSSDVDLDFLEQQIAALNDASYRARQLARWRLEQYPLATLQVIERCIENVDYNTGAQLVDLLSVMATHRDLSISVKSRQILGDKANRVSSIGRLADNAVRAIADLQEEQAIEILLHHGGRIGFPESLGFSINARVAMASDHLALWINERFTGNDETIAWIQFLKSIETVFLEGPNIDSRHFRAIAKLPNIKSLKLKHVDMTAEDLELFKSLTSLEHLGLNYVNIDDRTLSTLAELPISQSLRLYGTRISPAGAERLAKQLDGIEIYCGRGGYLGVGTDPSNTEVTIVTPGSGADQAGIRVRDEMTHIDGVPIKDFAELRAELGKHNAGDSIKVRVKRRVSPIRTESIELELEVTLGEDPK
jgi:hypothetical protein